MSTGPEFGNKNSFTKKSEHSKENNLPQAKNVLGSVKCFSKFTKRIYETCDCYFFNFAIILVAVVVLLFCIFIFC